MSIYNNVVTEPKFTFFLFNAEEIVLVNAIYSLSISSFVSKAFALILKSFPKSHQILDVFCPPKF